MRCHGYGYDFGYGYGYGYGHIQIITIRFDNCEAMVMVMTLVMGGPSSKTVSARRLKSWPPKPLNPDPQNPSLSEARVWQFTLWGGEGAFTQNCKPQGEIPFY